MVSTRSKVKAVEQGIASDQEPIDATAMSSEDVNSKAVNDPTGRPGKKRRHTQTVKSEKPREPKDGTLEALPLDIIVEIVSYLHPLDLLHLARTSKIFRKWLMSKTSSNVWRRVRTSLDIDMPECPPDQSEPQWVGFIFDPTCQVCGASGSTVTEWGFRVQGCPGCLEDSLILGSDVPGEYPGVNDIAKVLDLLPFAYDRVRFAHDYHNYQPPRSTKRVNRQYYRPAIRPMIELYQSYRAQVKTKAPNAAVHLADFIAEEKRKVAAFFEEDNRLRACADRRGRAEMQRKREKAQKWRDFYKDKLILLGLRGFEAEGVLWEIHSGINLEDGWEKNRDFFEQAVSRIKSTNLFHERLASFNTQLRAFLKQSDKKAPIRGLWPSPHNILTTNPAIKTILETGGVISCQDEILPSALDRWWETRKELLLDKTFGPGAQAPSIENPKDDQQHRGQGVPPFASSYMEATGCSRTTILDLAKAVFTCSCRTEGWLDICPIYWDESLVNHHCVRTRYRDGYTQEMDFPLVKFDAMASKQIDAICAALDLDPNFAKFTELDRLDARFRCAGCPYRREILNWRVAIKHQHHESKASHLPIFEKIADEEAAIVKAFELEHPDRSCPLGRIRSHLCDEAFYTTDELLVRLKDKYNQTELTQENHWVDPSIPPKPVLEADGFAT